MDTTFNSKKRPLECFSRQELKKQKSDPSLPDMFKSNYQPETLYGSFYLMSLSWRYNQMTLDQVKRSS